MFIRITTSSGQRVNLDFGGYRRIRNVADRVAAAYIFQAAKEFSGRPVSAEYVDLSVFTVINQKALEMDLVKALKNDTSPEAVSAAARVFVAPQTSRLPEDSFLSYETVEKVPDLVRIQSLDTADRAKTVIMFPNTDDGRRLLRAFVEYADLFDLQPVALTGVSGADYDIAWEEATYNCPRVAYAAAIDEMAEARRVSELAPRAKTEAAASGRRADSRKPEGASFNRFDVNNFSSGSTASEDPNDDE